MASVEEQGKNPGSWDEEYRRYQKALTSGYLIPVLARWSITLAGKRLLEVGCGDGGCAAEFHRSGCRVTAIDINERLVEIAQALNRKENLDISTHAGDICSSGCPGLDEGPFDLVVLRDVVEHLECLKEALDNIKSILSTHGAVFVVFPPYYSPYGAHQQILPRRKFGFIPYNKLPYIQLLPRAVFNAITSGDTGPHRDVASLREIRLTLGKFEKRVGESGLRISKRKFYLLRPTYKLRYGVPVVSAGALGRIPLLRELFVTAGYYLLEKQAR